jgi:hypothetical protein
MGFWNSTPVKDRPKVKFEVCAVTYGQGDCGFALISLKDFKSAIKELYGETSLKGVDTWYRYDPMEVTNKIPINRQAYFCDLMDMLKFMKKHDIQIKHAMHGHVY